MSFHCCWVLSKDKEIRMSAIYFLLLLAGLIFMMRYADIIIIK